MKKNFFPINLKKIRTHWKRTAGVKQDGFAGYTRTMMQTYEDYRVDAPFDLVLFISENTGIPIGDLITREILIEEIPPAPAGINMEKKDMEERKYERIKDFLKKDAVSDD